MVTYLNEAVAELIEQGSGPSSSWREKQGEMNELYEAVCIMARDKQNRLQDTLKEVSVLLMVSSSLYVSHMFVARVLASFFPL